VWYFEVREGGEMYFLATNRYTTWIFIALAFFIGVCVVGALRIFCLLRPSGHNIEAFAGDEDGFVPPKAECRVCGKEF